MTTQEKVKAWLYAFHEKNCRLKNIRFGFSVIQNTEVCAVGLSLSSNGTHLAGLNLYTEKADARFAAGSKSTTTIIFKTQAEVLSALRDIHQAIYRYWPQKFCTMVGPDGENSGRILVNTYTPETLVPSYWGEKGFFSFVGPSRYPQRIYAFLPTMRGMGYHHTEGFTAAGTTNTFTRRGQRFTFIHKAATVQSPADQVMTWGEVLAQATGTPRSNHRRARNKQRAAQKEIALKKRRWRRS